MGHDTKVITKVSFEHILERYPNETTFNMSLSTKSNNNVDLVSYNFDDGILEGELLVNGNKIRCIWDKFGTFICPIDLKDMDELEGIFSKVDDLTLRMEQLLPHENAVD